MGQSIAIIGCGNANRSDDGLGPEILRRLSETPPPYGAGELRLLDAGTDGMAVMFAARGCETLIIVDACRSGTEAGAIFEVPGGELERAPEASFNLHDFRWDNALFAGRKIFGDAFPTDVTVFLVEAETVAFGTSLSKHVSAAAETVVQRIREMVRARDIAGAGAL